VPSIILIFSCSSASFAKVDSDADEVKTYRTSINFAKLARTTEKIRIMEGTLIKAFQIQRLEKLSRNLKTHAKKIFSFLLWFIEFLAFQFSGRKDIFFFWADIIF